MRDEQGGEKFGKAGARLVFLRWEKLRLAYNVIVGLVGLVAIAPFLIDRFDPGFLYGAAPMRALLAGALVYGITANAAYFLGPALECYVRWLGLRSPWLTRVLFGAGTLCSVLITVMLAFTIWLQITVKEFLGLAP